MIARDSYYPIDSSHAVEIAPRVWWVGTMCDGELPQSHSYLIEQGEHSVLIDPGPRQAFAKTLQKINEIIPFDNIKYFLCHHSAPTVAGALPLIDQLVFRRDAYLVVHGLAKDNLLPYGCRLPLFLIENNDWKLELKDRSIDFSPIPYTPFVEAFTVYDQLARVMFSGELFGCGDSCISPLFIKEGHSLKELTAFHQYMMPSKGALLSSLKVIGKYDIDYIAPRHGSILSKTLIPSLISQLTSLDCATLLAKG